MPSILEPGVEQRLVLDCDVGKKPEPAFFVRSLSIRDFRATMGVLAKIRDADNKVPLIDEAMQGVCRVVTGWENITTSGGEVLPFSHEKLEDVLTVEEAIELLAKCLKNNTLSGDERKKSESQR